MTKRAGPPRTGS